jgi:hypothetical protein
MPWKKWLHKRRSKCIPSVEEEEVWYLFFNKHADAPQIPLSTVFWHTILIGLSLFP